MSALIVDAVVREGVGGVLDVHVVDDFYRTRRLKAAKNWGAGTAVKLRIEPEDEAYTYGQIKHYYGHLVSPLSEWNGEFMDEWHLRLKAMFMPEGKTSLTQLNREEFATYIRQCEVYAHTAHPEAFVLYDQISA